MILNKNSWHAKLYLSMENGLPNNLCRYFWGIALAVVCWTILLLMLVGFLVLGPIIIATEPLGIKNFSDFGDHNLFYVWWAGAKPLALSGFALASVLVLLFFLFEVLTKGPFFVMICETAKAKFTGYCPKIEWKE